MEKGQNQNKISYIRKPLARRGKMSLFLAATATLLGAPASPWRPWDFPACCLPW